MRIVIHCRIFLSRMRYRPSQLPPLQAKTHTTQANRHEDLGCTGPQATPHKNPTPMLHAVLHQKSHFPALCLRKSPNRGHLYWEYGETSWDLQYQHDPRARRISLQRLYSISRCSLLSAPAISGLQLKLNCLKPKEQAPPGSSLTTGPAHSSSSLSAGRATKYPDYSRFVRRRASRNRWFWHPTPIARRAASPPNDESRHARREMRTRQRRRGNLPLNPPSHGSRSRRAYQESDFRIRRR
jgi:hypothetical protein